MHSSLIDDCLFYAEHLPKLKQLFACDDVQVLAKQGGGNSVVFCVQVKNKKWAVKSYPPYAPNQRDRLAAELSVYQFLNQHQVPAVPALKAHCNESRWLIMEWVEGEVPQQYSSIDIDQAIQFIGAIARLNELPAAKMLPQAAEACLSLDILLQQIKQRLQRLQAIAVTETELNEFLLTRFIPLLEHSEQWARKAYVDNHLPMDEALSPQYRSLIPADFGFHNTLRQPSGKLYFFDFDYFGWDDPVKLLADILWHPKMNLSTPQQQQFIQGLAGIYRADALFLSRFSYTYPLFGLRWALILLNEFIPAFWLNRQHAEVYSSQDQAEVKRTQLKRANELLLRVEQRASL